jgi:hypothetical protein
MVSNYFHSLSPTCIYGVQSKCLISATMRVPAWAGNVATGLSLRDFPLLDAPCRMTATDDTVPNRYNITSLLCGGLTLSYALIPTKLNASGNQGFRRFIPQGV